MITQMAAQLLGVATALLLLANLIHGANDDASGNSDKRQQQHQQRQQQLLWNDNVNVTVPLLRGSGGDTHATTTNITTIREQVRRRKTLTNSAPTSSASQDDSNLVCRILQVDTRMGGFPQLVDEQSYHCIPWTPDGGDSRTSYIIDLPDDFVDTYKRSLIAGDTYFIVQNATIVDHQVILPQNISILELRRRNLQTATPGRIGGYRTVLILRVIARDSVPSLSKADLTTAFFDDATPTLRSQYRACSHGKMVMTPAVDFPRVGLVNGVMDVRVNIDAIGEIRTVVKNAATTVASNVLGLDSLGDVYDHVVYCLPPGTATGWLSYAFLNYFESVYNDVWCSFVSAQLHEVGHNFGLTHSSDKMMLYADRTDYMGFSYPVVNWPKICFNGHKLWLLGWVDDAKITVDPADNGLYKLVAHADYAKISDEDQYVVIRVLNRVLNLDPATDGLDYYLEWNVAKGNNINVWTYKNKVTIVQAYSTISNMVDALDENESYSFPYAVGRPRDQVVIKVCDRIPATASSPDYLFISVGINGDSCDQISQYPTAPPTAADDGGVCDDDRNALFTVDSTVGTKNCLWLAQNIIDWGQQLCQPGKRAYTYCRESCGRCSDNCWDNPTATFSVSGTNRNCAWLAHQSSSVRSSVCRNGQPAMDLCAETCNACASDPCSDDPITPFYVPGLGQYQTCPWLASSSRATWRAVLCRVGNPAYGICEETCGKCSDTCRDDRTFQFTYSDGSIRDCAWLALRPRYWDATCRSAAVASKCRETCDTCGS